MDQQIFKINQLNKLLQVLKEKKQKRVLIGGCFDIIHLGHIDFLKKAKELGGVLIVLLESDENIKINKGLNRPINPQSERAKILATLRMVDYVVELPEMKNDTNYDLLIGQIKPDIIALSKGDINFLKKERQALMVGAKLVEVNNLIENKSTSRIIDLISNSSL